MSAVTTRITRALGLAVCLGVVCLVVAAPVTLAATATSIGFEPGETTIEPGSTTTVDIVVDSVDAGVGSYNLTVTLEDESLGKITDVTIPDGQDRAPRNISYRDNRTTVTLGAVGLDTDGTGSVAIASVTVEAADSTGDTALDIDVSSLGNKDGNPYTVTETTGLDLSVSESGNSAGGGGGGGGGGGNGGSDGDDFDGDDSDDDSQTTTASSPTPTTDAPTTSESTTADSTTAATTRETTPTGESTTETGVPGFGIVGALVAVGTVSLIAVVRRY